MSKNRRAKTERPRLFGPGEDWTRNACVNYQHDEWHLYAEGYRRAAELLVEQSKRSELDFLIYPIAFLYRQWLELELKLLLRDGSRLVDRTENPPTRHHLKSLWDKVRTILEEVFPDERPDLLDRFGEIIDEFHDIDRTSTAFRYPADAAGNSSIPSLTHINVDQLAEMMDEARWLLDGAVAAVMEYLEFKHEREAEYLGEW